MMRYRRQGAAMTYKRVFGDARDEEKRRLRGGHRDRDAMDRRARKQTIRRRRERVE